MRTNRVFNSIFIRILFVVSLFALVIGCGGGTSGTGGSSGGGFQVTGIITSKNVPLAGVHISVSPTPPLRQLVSISISSAGRTITTDVTDGHGAFMLILDQKPIELSLRFKGDTFDSIFTVTNIPTAAASVKLDLTLNPQNDSIEATSEKYEDENGHEVE